MSAAENAKVLSDPAIEVLAGVAGAIRFHGRSGEIDKLLSQTLAYQVDMCVTALRDAFAATAPDARTVIADAGRAAERMGFGRRLNDTVTIHPIDVDALFAPKPQLCVAILPTHGNAGGFDFLDPDLETFRYEMDDRCLRDARCAFEAIRQMAQKRWVSKQTLLEFARAAIERMEWDARQNVT